MYGAQSVISSSLCLAAQFQTTKLMIQALSAWHKEREKEGGYIWKDRGGGECSYEEHVAITHWYIVSLEHV